MDRQDVKPPLLSWYGGKTGMAEWIVSLMPPHTAYLEPYAGSLAVLARKPRSESETVNDFNGEIVNLYRVCRESGEQLAAALAATPYAREEWDAAADPTEDPVERARRYVVRIEQMFAGDQLCSTWTVERSGSRRMGAWLNVGERVARLGRRLDGVFIEHDDALALIPKWAANPEALIYLDPPYTLDVRSRPYAFDVGAEHHVAMAQSVRDAEACVMVSGYENPAYEELFAGWTRHHRKTVVGGRGGPRSERREVIWINRQEDTLFGTSGSVA